MWGYGKDGFRWKSNLRSDTHFVLGYSRIQYLSLCWPYFRYRIDVWWMMKIVVYWWDKENDADDDHHWSLWSCSKWFHVSGSGIRCLVLLPKKTLVCKGSKLYRTNISHLEKRNIIFKSALVWFWKIHWNDGKWKWYWCLLNHQLKPSHGWHGCPGTPFMALAFAGGTKMVETYRELVL